MTLSVRRYLSLASMVLVAGLIILASRLDTAVRIQGAEAQMHSQGLAITELIAEASQHGIETFNAWELETTTHLAACALWVAHLDSVQALSPRDVARLVEEMDLWGIMAFAANGRLEVAGGSVSADPDSARNLPPGLLEALSREARGIHLFPQVYDPVSDQNLLGAAVMRHGGGAILLNLAMADQTRRRRELGPGHLIKTLADIPSISYVVIQDDTGIQAASTGSVDILPSASDPNLQPLFQGTETVTWEHPTALGPVLEVARLIELPPGKDLILRVGLDASLVNDLREDIRRRALIRMALFLGSMGLILSLFWAWQRQRALDREVAKITWELRMREEEAQRAGRLVAMGHLASGVAHQIRNPLNSIHMIAQVLKRTEDLPAAVTEHARQIRDESGRIESIIAQFLEFARPRRPVFTEVDLVPLARDVLAVQGVTHADVDFRLESGRSDVVLPLDRQLMVEILENLLRNAAEALQGTGKVVVYITRDRQAVEIAVADNGPGIPADLRDKIFDLYFTTRPQGSGLGLSLVSQMVSVMGGSLHLADGPGLNGRGARFVIRMPRQRRQG